MKKWTAVLAVVLGVFWAFGGMTLTVQDAVADDTEIFSQDAKEAVKKTIGGDNPVCEEEKMPNDANEKEEWKKYCAKDGKGEGDVKKLVLAILNTVYFLVGIVAVVIIIAGGVVLSSSAGMPQQVEKGKKMITGAVIGLIVTVAAFAITNFIVNIFSGV